MKQSSFKKVTRHSKENAAAIIKANTKLIREYEEDLQMYEDGTLDCSFKYGNYFNLIEDETKVVIQWLNSEEFANEVIADSLEEAIVIIDEIEKANGDLTGDTSIPF